LMLPNRASTRSLASPQTTLSEGAGATWSIACQSAGSNFCMLPWVVILVDAVLDVAPNFAEAAKSSLLSATKEEKEFNPDIVRIIKYFSKELLRYLKFQFFWKRKFAWTNFLLEEKLLSFLMSETIFLKEEKLLSFLMSETIFFRRKIIKLKIIITFYHNLKQKEPREEPQY